MAISFFQKISRAVMGRSRVDDDTLDAVEQALVESDMGVDTTLKIIDNLEDRVEKDKFMSFDELVGMLRDEIGKLIDDDKEPFDFSRKPYIILVVGVNGVGKTTTIGKLALMLKNQGKKVILGAADTFRAAAVDHVDPIAQAFVVSEPCFITRLQLYFKEVDLTSDSIWVELRTMQNGYPTTVSLGR